MLGPTCQCGLRYVVGSPEDEAFHARIHAEHEHGPVLPVLEHLTPAESFGDLSIFHIDRHQPIPVRRNFFDLALVWCRSIGGPAGYDGSDNLQLFVAADGTRAVGAVVTALDDYAWPLVWKSDGGVELRGRKAVEGPRHKVGRAWVAAAYRHRGFAIRLVEIASRVLNTPVADFGWELKFTAAGAGLVRRLNPIGFWGCCEGYLLREVLTTGPVKQDP